MHRGSTGFLRPKLIVMTLLLLSQTSTAEEITLTLVSSWNQQQNFTAHFLEYVKRVNERGKGIIQIDFMGGPEVIPQRQLLYALRRGVIDMAFGGSTYYRGILPEGDAMFAATITPQQARENGGIDALQPYWRERINAHLVGWMQSGIGPNIYLTDAPVFDDNGLPDLRGLKIRTSPTNVEMLKKLGARTVQIAVKEIYTAFQRGAVDGLAWPTIGFPDLGISEFVHYRIDPDVLQLAVALQVNLDVWNNLSNKAKNIITDQAIIYEQESRDFFFATRDSELDKLASDGFKSIAMSDNTAASYRNFAHTVIWDRFAKRSPEAAKKLKPYFYPEATTN
ncbi:MAG: TRAP transporter substrate-binding protein DctP [Pseudomonadota bacterium]|nr:TRAP transporter substrate-binding protein DctP [Pseudomonadota bacterium]